MTPAESLLNAIRSELAKKQAEHVPPGWLSIDEWADRWGRSESAARHALHDGVKVGMLEKRIFRVMNSRNRVHPVLHFRPIEKRKPQPSKPQKRPT